MDFGSIWLLSGKLLPLVNILSSSLREAEILDGLKEAGDNIIAHLAGGSAKEGKSEDHQWGFVCHTQDAEEGWWLVLIPVQTARTN